MQEAIAWGTLVEVEMRGGTIRRGHIGVGYVPGLGLELDEWPGVIHGAEVVRIAQIRRPICIGCFHTPAELPEYAPPRWKPGEYNDADDCVRMSEPTYNPQTGHFLCACCYVDAGCPSAPGGWVAP